MPDTATYQENILAYLKTRFAQPIVDQAIPDIDTVKRDAQGRIQPYIAVQFTGLRQGNGRSMIGPIGHDYEMVIRAQAIAPTPKIVRQLANKLDNELVGLTLESGSELYKKYDGSIFALVSSNNATECYQFPVSYGITIQPFV